MTTEKQSNVTTLPTLSEVRTALGCKAADLKELTAEDKKDLKRALAAERSLN